MNTNLMCPTSIEAAFNTVQPLYFRECDKKPAGLPFEVIAILVRCVGCRQLGRLRYRPVYISRTIAR
jgi:hypothetical protein